MTEVSRRFRFEQFQDYLAFERGLSDRTVSAYARDLGRWAGFLAATAVYGLVHVFTGNIRLVVAASVAGLVWGFLYLRFGRLWPGIISHVAWDLAVFLFFPLA